ncbi:MAG: hypothetical protein QOI13_496 [Paraburkholderia sp.]|nr:hypothetical protein [Paraburkholderia sp.]
MQAIPNDYSAIDRSSTRCLYGNSVHFPYEEGESIIASSKSLFLFDFLVRPAGIEPATPAFGGQYSIH